MIVDTKMRGWLVQNIVDDPEDVTRWLAYADWCDEQGFTGFAEAIRRWWEIKKKKKIPTLHLFHFLQKFMDARLSDSPELKAYFNRLRDESISPYGLPFFEAYVLLWMHNQNINGVLETEGRER